MVTLVGAVSHSGRSDLGEKHPEMNLNGRLRAVSSRLLQTLSYCRIFGGFFCVCECLVCPKPYVVTQCFIFLDKQKKDTNPGRLCVLFFLSRRDFAVVLLLKTRQACEIYCAPTLQNGRQAAETATRERL